jgi:hypothetical protein
VRGQLTQIGLGVLAADLVADVGDDDLVADAPEQILIGPPASWRMISPLLSRISFWYRLVRSHYHKRQGHESGLCRAVPAESIRPPSLDA